MEVIDNLVVASRDNLDNLDNQNVQEKLENCHGDTVDGYLSMTSTRTIETIRISPVHIMTRNRTFKTFSLLGAT